MQVLSEYMKWIGSDWAHRGVDIYGKSDNERSGRSVSISGNGNSIAIGSTRVHVYDWDGSSSYKKEMAWALVIV